MHAATPILISHCWILYRGRLWLLLCNRCTYPLHPPSPPPQLQDWIPHEGIAGRYASCGVRTLYPWQAAALECGEDGTNLVYCAPTSGVGHGLAGTWVD